MAFPNFDAEFVEGLDITAGGRPSQPTRQAYPANGFAANYQSAPYGPSALNMSPPPLTYRYSTSFNTPITNIADPSDYFGYHQVAGQNFGVSPHEYQSELQKFRQTPSSWTPNPSTLSFVPLSPSAVLNLTRPSSLQGLRGAPPTAPRAMLVLGSSPRQLNLEDIHPRPTGRISQTRPDKSRKDIVITSAGVLRNVIELREMRAPAGQIYEEDTGAFGADKYNFAEHLEDMNESARMSFFDQNFIEIEIDVAAIEAEAEARGEVRLFDAAQNEENDFKDTEHTHGNLALEVEQQKTDKKAHETKSFGEQVEKGFAKLSVEDQGKKMAAGPSREKYGKQLGG
ncbi:hypothetical protein M7I_6311 [Glarea lozoyensis 74030]|uniref:Uncharacterized protein n=1 Tax=Glarea lozoyensis (strain ATCC 74030 / MF5533) TaxID=1104152 RepID=H0EU80_GLAL7|nr:hypothetical protein M7I_6311 [Glarea lozoyensis 74030]